MGNTTNTKGDLSPAFKTYSKLTVLVVVSNGVSVLFALLLIVAIARPLLLEPKRRTPAMSCNVYILFLAAIDLVLSLVNSYVLGLGPFFFIDWDGTEDWIDITTGLDRFGMEIFWDDIIQWWSVGSMFFLIAIICDVILRLLRNSKMRRKSRPPTLQRAMFHGMASFAVGVFGGSIGFVTENVDMKPWKLLAVRWTSGVIIIGLPVFYCLWVSFCVYKEELAVVNAKLGGRLRYLLLYFCRIILLYCIVLFTLITFGIGRYGRSEHQELVWMVTYIVWGFQGWVSFPFLISKPDLFNFVCVLFPCKQCRPKKTITNKRVPRWAETAQARAGGTGDNSELEVGHEEEESEEQRISRCFMEGIEDYLSDDEDADDDEKEAAIHGSNDDLRSGVERRRSSISVPPFHDSSLPTQSSSMELWLQNMK
mmetsp:Transcript_8291/g.17244  ORF Transcript_8291/g.17244 Transcript_8291/m.17244 type:complete len:423 (-) Transcript_8291:2062-3330(-)